MEWNCLWMIPGPGKREMEKESVLAPDVFIWKIDLLPEREKTIHRDLSFSFGCSHAAISTTYLNLLSFSSRIKSTALNHHQTSNSRARSRSNTVRLAHTKLNTLDACAPFVCAEQSTMNAKINYTQFVLGESESMIF